MIETQIIPCSRDRYQAHRDVERVFHDGERRSYQWRLLGDRAEVRTRFGASVDELTGCTVEFEIDALPQRQRGAIKGRPGREKRRVLYLEHPVERQNWICSKLAERAGLIVIEVTARALDRLIVTNDSAFVKPGARFTGKAVVRDTSLLQRALENGIGDAKAYGYGMLIINP